jgi:hypothetical protein
MIEKSIVFDRFKNFWVFIEEDRGSRVPKIGHG